MRVAGIGATVALGTLLGVWAGACGGNKGECESGRIVVCVCPSGLESRDRCIDGHWTGCECAAQADAAVRDGGVD